MPRSSPGWVEPEVSTFPRHRPSNTLTGLNAGDVPTESSPYVRASSPGRWLVGGRAYWICQTGGWGTVGLVEFLTDTNPPTVRRWVWVAWLVGFVALGMGITHGLRALALAREWHSKGIGSLVLRVIVASIFCGLIITLVAGPIAILVQGIEVPPEEWFDSSVSLVAFSSLIFVGWSIAYFGFHYYRAYQGAALKQARLESSLRHAQLETLRGQLDPHFLFNSLNTIRSLIPLEATSAREAVNELASVLRTTLYETRESTIPLRMEMETVRQYLALEQRRHCDRMSVHVHMADAVADDPVPPLLIQTLVENAVKHGIEPNEGGGRITVNAVREGGTLEIRISNPGRLSQSQGEAPNRQSRNHAGGLGLENSRIRLNLIFGSKASLELHQSTPGTIEAVVRIPMVVPMSTSSPSARQ